MSSRQTPPDLGRIDGAGFLQILHNFQASLHKHEADINSLNVFPVPDSDTGTNSLLTVESGISGLGEAPEKLVTLETVARKFAQYANTNARGNSGTILAEYFRGFSAGLTDYADVQIWKSSLQMAAKYAHEAVLAPCEGTILSVAKAIAEVSAPTELFAYLGDITHVAKIALLKTTSQLPQLQQAQVVDAGACVLVLFHEVVSSYFNGHPINISFAALDANFSEVANYSGPEFELTLLLTTRQDARDILKTSLSKLGDSLTIAGVAPEFKVHIHTDSVDEVIAIVKSLGEVSMVNRTTLAEKLTKA